jgi:hypothetical protein
MGDASFIALSCLYAGLLATTLYFAGIFAFRCLSFLIERDTPIQLSDARHCLKYVGYGVPVLAMYVVPRILSL